MSKSFVQKLLEMKKTEGHLEPRKQGGGMKSELDFHQIQLIEMVEKYPDATLSEPKRILGTKLWHVGQH